MKFDFFICNSLSKRFEKGFLCFLFFCKQLLSVFFKNRMLGSFRMRYLSI
ncbi:hypothetical protein HPHPH21_0978 [Helicobacter pylori Hp H-21]|nr:hypothetical protein HPHPH21_0978 [Helicobacter pylori Hp H-21]